MDREAGLLTEWYAPALAIAVDAPGYRAAWHRTWQDLLGAVEADPVLVLRDYHADNLMVLPGSRLGLLDFQDALAGHRAYDLVSLLQDARRDVDPVLEDAMLERYCAAAGIDDRERFRAHYEILGAQRNSKILGIFTRLWKRHRKPR
jgi:aminoglycoside/choline kinase family phosphotransferase